MFNNDFQPYSQINYNGAYKIICQHINIQKLMYTQYCRFKLPMNIASFKISF